MYVAPWRLGTKSFETMEKNEASVTTKNLVKLRVQGSSRCLVQITRTNIFRYIIMLGRNIIMFVILNLHYGRGDN